MEIGVHTPNYEETYDQLSQEQLAEISETCACLNVRKAARAMTQLYDQVLQPSGLHATQFNLLVAAALAREVPLTCLAEVLVLDRTTFARNLKAL